MVSHWVIKVSRNISLNSFEKNIIPVAMTVTTNTKPYSSKNAFINSTPLLRYLPLPETLIV